MKSQEAAGGMCVRECQCVCQHECVCVLTHVSVFCMPSHASPVLSVSLGSLW